MGQKVAQALDHIEEADKPATLGGFERLLRMIGLHLISLSAGSAAGSIFMAVTSTTSGRPFCRDTFN
ncbi:hypothetical protein TUM17387_38160 [Shewanella carassii]|nr:hypothetical protein TUM17387_38160 [Shewanella carassii]